MNEVIGYQSPSKEDAFLLEGRFGAVLCFSNLAFEDLLFVLFAILLENPVVFVSEKLTLLSSTMYQS
jgi:hypothetical protein